MREQFLAAVVRGDEAEATSATEGEGQASVNAVTVPAVYYRAFEEPDGATLPALVLMSPWVAVGVALGFVIIGGVWTLLVLSEMGRKR